MSTTAAAIIGYAEGITGIQSSTIGIPGCEETMLLSVIDKANREYFNKRKLGGGETSLQSEDGGDLVSDTQLEEDITSATTDFDVTSSTSFGTSGALGLWTGSALDVCEFTGNAANNFTGVTGVDYSHSDGDSVSKLYALPSDFASFRSTELSPNGVRVEGSAYLYSSAEPHGARFSVYDNGTTKYLIFPRGCAGSYHVTYNRKPTTISSTSSTIDVPIDDEDFVIYRVSEHIFTVLGMFDRAQWAQNKANKVNLDSLKRRNIGKRPKLGRRVEMSAGEYETYRLFS